MALWVRFERSAGVGFGTLEGGVIRVHSGDMFGAPAPTGEEAPLADVKLRTPTQAPKLLGLVNNYREAAAKQGIPIPSEPLYFLKPPSSYLAPGEPIRLPAPDVGKVIYEGEIGVVVGRRARGVAEEDADRFIFGYTCVNDVTALDLIGRDPGFAQWTRAKGFDTFGAFGPGIATGLDPDELSVRTVLKGKVRQEYPCSDMVFSPRALVSHISRVMTLEPGDVIACGTSLGVGVLRPGSTVEVVIEGIGSLANPVQAPEAA
jgi:2-keto-4-pentenoate hydratase/2-oxohepta-3-ene-1,7-dioic acid hydratase in catechol pathway